MVGEPWIVTSSLVYPTVEIDFIGLWFIESFGNFNVEVSSVLMLAKFGFVEKDEL